MTYTANAQFRSDKLGLQVCLRLREVAPGGAVVKAALRCPKTVSTGWARFAPVSLVPARSGDSIAVTVYATSPAGSSFEVDAVVLEAIPMDRVAPQGPTTLTGAEVADGVQLEWDAATDDVGVAGYRISRNGLKLPDITSVGYTDRAVQPGRSYTYTVQAFDAAGNVGAASPAFTLATSGTATAPCGTSTATPAYEHIVVIAMENAHYDRIIGSPRAPFINQLVADCGSATNYVGITNPSLPNYIHTTSGRSPITINCLPSATCTSTDQSIFHQTTWLSPAEGMTVNCQKTAAGSTTGYAPRHNPAVYYSSLTDCASRSVPLGSTIPLTAAFTFVVPNLCHDMHDACTTARSPTYTWAGDPAGCTSAALSSAVKLECRIEQGDKWLSQIVPAITSSPEYTSGTTAVFLWWDEDSSPHVDNHIPFIVVSPTTPAGTVATARYDHYSALRTWQDMLGLPCLANACTAASMRADFGL